MLNPLHPFNHPGNAKIRLESKLTKKGKQRHAKKNPIKYNRKPEACPGAQMSFSFPCKCGATLRTRYRPPAQMPREKALPLAVTEVVITFWTSAIHGAVA